MLTVVACLQDVWTYFSVMSTLAIVRASFTMQSISSSSTAHNTRDSQQNEDKTYFNMRTDRGSSENIFH